jgi:YD repeat-containing protein
LWRWLVLIDGALRRHSDHENPRTTTTQYAQGLLPVQVSNPLRQTVTTAYDYRFQAPLQVTDANQATTTTHYDAFGRLVRVDLPLCSAAVTAAYGDFAFSTNGQPYAERLRQRTDACTGGNPVYNDLYVFYRGLGRKLQAQQNGDNGDTLLTAVAYDAKGRLVTSGVPYTVAAAPGTYQAPTWAAGQTTTKYDALARPLRVIAPDGSVTRTEYGWDTTGEGAAPTLRLLTRSFDANGHRKDQVADEWGNLIRVREYRWAQ